MTQYRQFRRLRSQWPNIGTGGQVRGEPQTPQPVVARVINHVLGGVHTFGPDRAFAAQAEKVCPGFGTEVQATRGFGERAVRWLALHGIDQFIDIGCGIPSRGATHEVLSWLGRPSRAVYVDNDPTTVLIAEEMASGHPTVTAIRGDLRDPASILGHRDVRRWLDWDRPVGVLLAGVLEYLANAEDPARIVHDLTSALAPGSYLAVSHPVHRPEVADRQLALRRLFRASGTPLYHRSHDDVAAMLAGLDLIDPGLVLVHTWRPQLAEHWRPEPAPATVGAVAHLRPGGAHVPTCSEKGLTRRADLPG